MNALTEEDFTADPGLALQPGQVGVTFLEATDATSPAEPDSETLGTDTFPVEFPAAVTVTLTLDPGDLGDTVAKVELKRWDDTVVATLTAAAPSVSVSIEPGRHRVVVTSGYRQSEAGPVKPRVVFLRPSPTPSGSPARIDLILSAGSCVGCDLRGVTLEHSYLPGLDLRGANLTGASLEWSWFDGSNFDSALLDGVNAEGAFFTASSLRGAKLANANLYRTRFDRVLADGADFSGSVLRWSYFMEASLTSGVFRNANLLYVDFTKADLTNADLEGANATKAIFTGSTLTGANLQGATFALATWTDGRTCFTSSVGMCGP